MRNPVQPRPGGGLTMGSLPQTSSSTSISTTATLSVTVQLRQPESSLDCPRVLLLLLPLLPLLPPLLHSSRRALHMVAVRQRRRQRRLRMEGGRNRARGQFHRRRSSTCCIMIIIIPLRLRRASPLTCSCLHCEPPLGRRVWTPTTIISNSIRTTTTTLYHPPSAGEKKARKKKEPPRLTCGRLVELDRGSSRERWTIASSSPRAQEREQERVRTSVQESAAAAAAASTYPTTLGDWTSAPVPGHPLQQPQPRRAL